MCVYLLAMRYDHEQACMDIKTTDGKDCIDLLLAMPKLQGRVWKHLFNLKDLDGQIATTNKEVSEALGVAAPNISTAISWLIGHEDIQRDGIHFYVNPYRWWFGSLDRRHIARVSWDKRKNAKVNPQGVKCN